MYQNPARQPLVNVYIPTGDWWGDVADSSYGDVKIRSQVCSHVRNQKGSVKSRIWAGCIKTPPSRNRAHAAKPLHAPSFFSTPLCKVRYQKMAAFAERCCFCREKSPLCRLICSISYTFSILYKKAVAHLDRIRGPPSEI